MADFEVKFVEQEKPLSVSFSNIQVIGDNLPYLSQPGEPADLIEGKQLIGKNGEVIEGIMQNARAAKF